MTTEDEPGFMDKGGAPEKLLTLTDLQAAGLKVSEHPSFGAVDTRSFAETRIPMILDAYGLKEGTAILELALLGGAVLRNLTVTGLILAGDPPLLIALRVGEDGARGSHLIPWHAIAYLLTGDTT